MCAEYLFLFSIIFSFLYLSACLFVSFILFFFFLFFVFSRWRFSMLSHKHITRFKGLAYRDPHDLFLILEYAENGSLYDYLGRIRRANSSVSFDNLTRWSTQVRQTTSTSLCPLPLHIHTYLHAYTHTCAHTHTHTQTNRQTNKQTKRQTNKQTNKK